MSKGKLRKKIYKCFITMLCMFTVFPITIVDAAVINNGAIYGIDTNNIANWPQGPEIYSETAVLMEAETGVVLYNKGMNEKRYPASITKIMTAMLALEHCTLDEQVVFTETCLQDQIAGSGNIAMQVGEILTMEECLLACMVRSANDVATQIAEHVGGTVENFVNMMNQKAQELGCQDTHFANASGMPDDNHYSTAYDMALIFQEAIKNEDFVRIIGTQSFSIGPTNMNAEVRTFSSHHALVAKSAPECYEGCFGGKTGVTDAAKNTLVSGATRNGMTLIAVSFRAEPGEVVYDHTQLFNYGFDHFEKVPVEGGAVVIPNGVDYTTLYMEEKVENNTNIRQYYYAENYYVGNAMIVIPTSTPEILMIEETDEVQSEKNLALETNDELEKAEQTLKDIYWYIIYIFIGVVGISLIITIVASMKKRKKKRKH